MKVQEIKEALNELVGQEYDTCTIEYKIKRALKGIIDFGVSEGYFIYTKVDKQTVKIVLASSKDLGWTRNIATIQIKKQQNGVSKYYCGNTYNWVIKGFEVTATEKSVEEIVEELNECIENNNKKELEQKRLARECYKMLKEKTGFDDWKVNDMIRYMYNHSYELSK